MAIMTYNDGDHKAGFIGIRVVVMGASKVYRQRYFNFRKGSGWVTMAEEEKILEDARNLESKWKAFEAGVKLLHHNHVALSFSIKKNRGVPHPALIINAQASKKNGQRIMKSLTLSIDRQLNAAWYQITNQLCREMNWPIEKRKQMLDLLDNVKVWRLNEQRLAFNKGMKEGQKPITKRWLMDRVGDNG